MSGELFARTGRLRKGYRLDQVEEFLDRARGVWDEGGPPGPMTAWHVRTVGFDLRRNGYEVGAVDTALDRIEDAFVAREEGVGPASWREAEDAVLARLQREAGTRFPPGSFWTPGYRRADVDVLCGRVQEHLVMGRPLGVEDVRTSVFRAARGRRGYGEAPVDAFLDRVVEVMRRRGSA